MYKESLKEQAITLRRAGYPYSHISRKTGISKSTLSGWLASIPYTPNQETITALGKARAAAGERKAVIRQNSLQEIKGIADKDIGLLSQRDLFLFGLGLYLGEGSKTHGFVRLVNSDPEVIKAIVAWFLSLGVKIDQFSATIHLYPDSDIKESLQFWSQTTTIPIAQFYKTQVDRRADKKVVRKGRLPHGTLHLGVKSMSKKEFGVLFSRKIQAWNDNVLQKINQAGLV